MNNPVRSLVPNNKHHGHVHTLNNCIIRQEQAASHRKEDNLCKVNANYMVVQVFDLTIF